MEALTALYSTGDFLIYNEACLTGNEFNSLPF